MENLRKFIDQYYDDNLSFDQNGFLNMIDFLIKDIEVNNKVKDLNKVLSKILNAFELHDKYLVMQIIEYELLPELL